MRFRSLGVLVAVLLLAAAFAAVPAALAEGSETAIYSNALGPDTPAAKPAGTQWPTWCAHYFTVFKTDKNVTLTRVEFLAALVTPASTKIHYSTTLEFRVVSLSDFMPEENTEFDVAGNTVYTANFTFDYYDLYWGSWSDVFHYAQNGMVGSWGEGEFLGTWVNLTFSDGPTLSPGYYAFSITDWPPSQDFPGIFVLAADDDALAFRVHRYNATSPFYVVSTYSRGVVASLYGTPASGSGGGEGSDYVSFVEPANNAEVSGTVNVIVYATSRPTLYVDDQNFGQMRGGINNFYMAILDTTSLEDGVHTLTAKVGNAEDSVSIVVANHPTAPGGGENTTAVKVEWLVPRDGAEVSTRFKYVVAVAWSGGPGYQPSVSITVNDYTLPAPAFLMPAPSQGEMRAIGEIDLSQILENLSEKQQVTLTATASLGNASDSAVIHVFYPGQGHRTHAPSGYVVPTGSGFRVYSDTAVAVIGHFSDRDVPGKQVAAGVWYVPRPNGQVIAFALDTPSFEIIGPDGNSTIITITSSVGGWLETPHFGTPIPGWAWAILVVVVLVFLFGRRGKRRFYRRRRW